MMTTMQDEKPSLLSNKQWKPRGGAEIYVASQMCEPLFHRPLKGDRELEEVTKISSVLYQVIRNIEQHSESPEQRDSALSEGAMQLRELVERLQAEDASSEDDVSDD